MHGRLARTVSACVITGVASGAAATPAAAQAPHLAVCLSRSQKVSINAREAVVVLAESNVIWRPHGVSLRWTEQFHNNCDRLIAVKGDQDALAEDAAGESALGWVPFVEGRARQLVFLRVSRARTLVNALSPGTRPEMLTEFLVAKLLGRILAHELGHVLLNSRSHADSGLMRALSGAKDLLKVPASAYTLNAVERAHLFGAVAGEPRVAAR